MLTGLLSGCYPALLLSGFKPIEVLTNRFKGKTQKDYFRQIMVVGQFAIAIFLIIGTGVVFNQLRYMQHKDLGYNKEQLLYIPVETETLRKNYTVLKDKLLQMPEILSVSSGRFRLSRVGSSTSGINWEGKTPEEHQLFVSIGANFDILKTIDAQILAGRDFSIEYGADSLNFIINEAAAKAMGMEDPVGQRLSWGDGDGQIVGLVKDFHINSLHYTIDPAFLYIEPDMSSIYVKLQTKEIAATLDKLEDLVSTYNPNYPFDYSFATDDYDRLYRSEQRVSKLSGIFAVLAIFVCCLGLFGLALFTIEQRTREIGIRKVLGASVAGIVSLLSRDFLKLVFFALLVAVPLAWYFSNQWLQGFYYKIDTPWMLFLLAGGLSVFIAFITVSIQSVKAALANPVESLKNE